MNPLDFNVVLQFSVERFRQQKAEAASHDGHDAVDQQRAGVMVGGQQCDQRGEDAAHAAAHGRDAHAVVPARGAALEGQFSRTSRWSSELETKQELDVLPQTGRVQLRSVHVDVGEGGGHGEFPNDGDGRDDHWAV